MTVAVQQFADKVVENINVEDDYVWVHLSYKTQNIKVAWRYYKRALTAAIPAFCHTAEYLTSAVQQFADKVVENINVEDDYVWVHDYHLLALPSLLRKVRSSLLSVVFLFGPPL